MKFYAEGGFAGEVKGYTLAGDPTPDGTTRSQLLSQLRKGELSSIQFPARVFVQGPNRNHFVIPDAELDAFAASFVDKPFLKDHDDRQDAVGGTIIESKVVEHEGKKAIRQVIEAVKPWAMESVADRTIKRFSIGWFAAKEMCTSCEVEFMDPKCKHGRRDLGREDPDTKRVVELRTEGNEGIEVSAVVNPAVPGTGIEALCQLKEQARTGMVPDVVEGKEKAMKEKLLKLLSLPSDTEDAEVLKALEQKLSAPPRFPAAALTALGLTAETDNDVAIAKVVGMSAPGAFVAKKEHDEVANELKALKAEKRVAKLKAEGKITPADEAWALKVAVENPEGFDAFFKDAPVRTPLNAIPPPILSTDTTTEDANLSEIAVKLGVDPKIYAQVVADERRLAAGGK